MSENFNEVDYLLDKNSWSGKMVTFNDIDISCFDLERGYFDIAFSKCTFRAHFSQWPKEEKKNLYDLYSNNKPLSLTGIIRVDRDHCNENIFIIHEINGKKIERYSPELKRLFLSSRELSETSLKPKSIISFIGQGCLLIIAIMFCLTVLTKVIF